MRESQTGLGRRRLTTALLAYGIVGLILAVAGLIALAWVGGRVAGVTDRVQTQVGDVIDVLDRTSQALRDAASSATSFSATLERTPPAVRQTAQAIADLRGNLRAIEDQFGRIDILGSRPLGNVAGQFGQMATDLDGLDTRLGTIAADLEGNRDALGTNSTSLQALADRLAGVAADARGSTESNGLGDLPVIIVVLGMLLVGWTAVPSVGALWLGLWLRRQDAVERVADIGDEAGIGL
ncbi:MAG TPA: hypothetical protein VFJ80_13110 [Candidatus Limnocylindrales bacterium]|nr:hypothetical protein [Candidatus Limnocylindrales bacterium]